MTILLVLSLISAIFWIFGSFILSITIPTMTEIIQNGEIDKLMAPLNEKDMQDFMANMSFMTQINTKYWLFKLILYIASLVGVIKMFKCDKRGFHIYSIAQICMLINSSVFYYPLQRPSTLVPDLMLTAIFILLYYMYFKRMELADETTNLE